MAKRNSIPIDVLRQLIRLEPETGKLFWLSRPGIFFEACKFPHQACAVWNGRYAGKEAFTAPSYGYQVGTILSIRYPAHRVIFALDRGRWPDGDVDHEDTNRSHNHPKNLREATNVQNLRNSGSKGGTSQFCGVCWDKSYGKWVVYCRIGVGKKRLFLGRFTDETEAAKAYDRAAATWHGEFARLNFPLADVDGS